MSTAPHPPLVRHILHLEDSQIDHDMVKLILKRSDLSCDLQRVETLPDFLDSVQNTPVDVILADYRLPGFTAIDAWTALL